MRNVLKKLMSSLNCACLAAVSASPVRTSRSGEPTSAVDPVGQLRGGGAVGGGHHDAVVGAGLGEHRLGGGVVGGDHREAGDPLDVAEAGGADDGHGRRRVLGERRRPCRRGPSPGRPRSPGRARPRTGPRGLGRCVSSNGLRRSSSIQVTPIVPPMPSVVVAVPSASTIWAKPSIEPAAASTPSIRRISSSDAGVDPLLHVAACRSPRRRCGGRRRRCPRCWWRRARRRSSPWCR